MREWLLKSFWLLSLAFMLVSVTAWAQERGVKPTGVTRIITIAGGEVNPARIEIQRGDTVIWTVLDQPANVYFAEGDEVRLACVAPTRFRLNEDGAYTSGIIPVGGTASLCFVEPGTYHYVVFMRGGMGGQVGPPAGVPMGTIVVR